MKLAGDGAHTVISVAFGSLFPFFTTDEARTLRLICREFRDTVTAFPWTAGPPVRSRFRSWRRSFPLARMADISYTRGIGVSDYIYFQGLRELNAMASQVTDEFIPHLRGIRVLNLARCAITGAHFEALSDLRSLTLDDCPVADAAFVHLKGLQRLSVRGCGVTNAAFAHLKSLKRLDIAWCTKLTDAVFDELTLEELNVSWCRWLTDAAFTRFTSLRALTMIYCTQISSAAFVHLVNLEDLNISRCRQLNSSIFDRLSKLRRLDMMACTGVQPTAELLTLLTPHLEYLCIEDCPMMNRVALNLGFPDLYELGLRFRHRRVA